jgi:hypothetical protein
VYYYLIIASVLYVACIVGQHIRIQKLQEDIGIAHTFTEKAIANLTETDTILREMVTKYELERHRNAELEVIAGSDRVVLRDILKELTQENEELYNRLSAHNN